MLDIHPDIAVAYDQARWYAEVFEGRCFMEVMGNLEDQIRLLRPQRQLAKKLGVPVIATNDVHYLDREDGMENGPHHILVQGRYYKKKDVAEQTADKSDVGYGQWYGSDGFYLKSGDEMLATGGLLPDEIARTLDVLGLVDFDFGEVTKPSPPTAVVPTPGEDEGFDRWLALR